MIGEKKLAAIVLTALLLASHAGQAQRIGEGLVALYEFNDGQGTTVSDTSGFGDPLDLFIEPRDLSSRLIEWGDGFISINRGTSTDKTEGTIAPIESNGPALKIYDAIVNPDLEPTNEFTVEAWIVPERDGTPGNELDSNPARIVSMSLNTSYRNFTVGQENPGDTWVSRIRNSEAGRNGTGGGIGQMATPLGSVQAETLTHLVLTRDTEGTETLYYNTEGAPFGEFVDRDIPSTLTDGGGGQTAGGDPGATDWNPDYGLALGDETNVGERKWVGDFHLVAIYSQALTYDEVQQNFEAGPEGSALPRLRAGDADQDLDFDQLDLVKVQIAAKYLTGEEATWGEGDWDGAPGGSPGSPPAGNGLFDQLDIIAALAEGTYLTGPYAALGPDGRQNDGQTSIVYNPDTGVLGVDAPAGTELTSVNIDSAAGIFTGTPAENLGGSFDNDADNNIFKATFGSSFGSLSFGNVAQPGLDEQTVLNDLTVVGSLAGGGDLGAVDLIYVPEPSSLTLLVCAMAIIGCWRRR